MNCDSCGKPLVGGSMWNLFKCNNPLCVAGQREFTLKPLAKPHAYKRKFPKRRAA